jgi:hypothetical protein
MCDVIWCHTTAEGAAMVWAAFIGFAGGLAALVGALIVGSRQIGIQERQTKVVEATLGLEELTVKAQLFEKRLAVYDAARAFVREIVVSNHVPGWGSSNETRQVKLDADFREAMDRSRFLFRPSVSKNLAHIWRLANEFHFHVPSPGPADESEDEKNSREVQEIVRKHAHFLAVLDTMSDIFGDELVLSSPPARQAEVPAE